MKPLILLDVDGVLADFASAAVSVANTLLGRSHQLAEVDRFDFCDALKIVGAERDLVMQSVTAMPGFARLLKPYPHARDLVDGLRAIGDVLFVTSPWDGHETWAHERREWLREHVGVASDREVVSTSAKLHVDGDVLIDDRSKHLDEWCRQRTARGATCSSGILWRTPHNVAEVWDWSTDNAAAAIDLVRALADVERTGKAARR